MCLETKRKNTTLNDSYEVEIQHLIANDIGAKDLTLPWYKYPERSKDTCFIPFETQL